MQKEKLNNFQEYINKQFILLLKYQLNKKKNSTICIIVHNEIIILLRFELNIDLISNLMIIDRLGSKIRNK